MKFWLSVVAVLVAGIIFGTTSDETLGDRISSNIMNFKTPTAYAASSVDDTMTFSPLTVHQKIDVLLEQNSDCQSAKFFLRKQRTHYAPNATDSSVNRELTNHTHRLCQ